MNPVWIAKYQYVVPAVFISFFTVTSDPNTDSLRDNQLKTEIATIRNSLEDSKYRSRYCVVLVGDESVVNGPELEERVINIRRAARLEEKCVFFVDAKAQTSELFDFASRVINTMHPQALEFYRDLTRHARRKRDKGGNPIQNISRLGWLARYEYKLGVFAEFRAEADVAARHYNTAMMAFFDGQGPFENTSSWSPRWNEARLWADTTFIRLIRAQLAIGLPTAAVRNWTRHRDRTRDLLRRKAKGTDNYGYSTWEARWSEIMGDLTRPSSGLFEESLEDNAEHDEKRAVRVFAKVERLLLQEQQTPPAMVPWQLLHHAGYWLLKSIALTKRRLEYALEIPEDDRVAPGQSPASTVARRSEAYDTYLAFEPHSEGEASEHKKGDQRTQLTTKLGRAAADFEAYQQYRFADVHRLELCQQLMQAMCWGEAMAILTPLWQRTRWRADQWRSLLEQLSAALHQCAIELSNSAMRLATLWELSSSALKPVDGIEYNIPACLKSIAEDTQEQQTFKIDAATSLSCLKVSFAFGSDPAYVGIPLSAQLVVEYEAHHKCSPLIINSIVVDFDASLPRFGIKHVEIAPSASQDGERNSVINSVAFEENANTSSHPVMGQTDLRFEPGQIKAFDVLLTPEEAGKCSVGTAVALIGQDNAVIEHISPLSVDKIAERWLLPSKSIGTPRDRAQVASARSSIVVQPRPPRMDVDFIGLRNIYYTDEDIQLELDIINEEEEQADVELEVQALSDSDLVPTLRWRDPEASGPESTDVPSLHTNIGKLSCGQSTSRHLGIESSKSSRDMVVEARLSYTLPSSAGRKIVKAVNVDVVVIRPFEATQQLLPDYHNEAWPNYFEIADEDALDADAGGKSDASGTLTGITTKWQYNLRITSFATDTLVIENVWPTIAPLKSKARIIADRQEDETAAAELISNGQHTLSFTLTAQKRTMDEHRPIISIPAVKISWRRLDGSVDDIVETILELPKLSIGSSEPRVLARQLPNDHDGRTVALEYVIENPSLHFLTFNVVVEPSEDFAFSGSKSSSLQLTPLSRHGIKYVFMPFAQGAPIKPMVKVTDVYFNKVLNVIPTGALQSDQGELVACAKYVP